MRFSALLSTLFILLFASAAHANWQKINDVDYTFGPFKIYNISLFTETGEYHPNIRPLMLTLKYDKPVDGRDFAISLARSWENLGIKVENQTAIINHLRKAFPNIDPKDNLSYIALADKGYFVLNDTVLSDEFSSEVNDAIVAVWLDPRVEIGKKITVKKKDKTETVTVPIANSNETAAPEKTAEQAVKPEEKPENSTETNPIEAEKKPEQAVKTEEKSANSAETNPAETEKKTEQAVKTEEKSANSAETNPAEPEKKPEQAVKTEEKSANSAETNSAEPEKKPEQAVKTEEKSANSAETNPTETEKTAEQAVKAEEKSETPAEAPAKVNEPQQPTKAEEENAEPPAPVIDAPVVPSLPTS